MTMAWTTLPTRSTSRWITATTPTTPQSSSSWLPFTSVPRSSGVLHSNQNDEEDDPTAEGADLAAEFFQLASQKGLRLDASELDDEEDDEDDDELEEDDDEDEEINIPQGAVNAFLGYDTNPGVGDKLAGNVSLTNDQLYSEVKERVLDTAGGFVQYVQGARDEDDYDDDDDATSTNQQRYQPPTVIPNAEWTAGEVVLTVLQALQHNAVPTPNTGVEILFGFSSPQSPIWTTPGLTPDEYADYWSDQPEYKVLLGNLEVDDAMPSITIEKADYSSNGQKCFMTARLVTTQQEDPVNVNFILSACPNPHSTTTTTTSTAPTTVVDDDDDDDNTDEAASSSIFSSTPNPSSDVCWLIDSILIRPESMRRRRRR